MNSTCLAQKTHQWSSSETYKQLAESDQQNSEKGKKFWPTDNSSFIREGVWLFVYRTRETNKVVFKRILYAEEFLQTWIDDSKNYCYGVYKFPDSEVAQNFQNDWVNLDADLYLAKWRSYHYNLKLTIEAKPVNQKSC